VVQFRSLIRAFTGRVGNTNSLYLGGVLNNVLRIGRIRSGLTYTGVVSVPQESAAMNLNVTLRCSDSSVLATAPLYIVSPSALAFTFISVLSRCIPF